MDFTLETAADELTQALSRNLPGARAQRLMAPIPRPTWDPSRAAPPGRPAAVLILFYPREDTPGEGASHEDPSRAPDPEPMVVLTARTATVESHKGQIAYPGGGIEPGESPEETALREAHEEVGLDPSLPRLLGRLTPLWVPATGYTIQPVVAVATRRPQFAANPGEVARIIECPLSDLLDPAVVRIAVSDGGKRWLRAPFFALPAAKLWGASAMITAEWLSLLGWPGLPAEIPEIVL